MSTLQDRLKRLKEQFLERAPAAAVEAIARSNEELRESGILSQIPAVGDPLPAFSLEDSEGQLVTSSALLHRGPLVVTFYRGGW